MVFNSKRFFLFLISTLIIGLTTTALAADQIDSGDTAWMMTSTVLVLMMTIPGLFLFYGGLVRSKNALGTIMHSFIIAALVGVQWVVIGYTLAFGPDVSGVIGNLDWISVK